MKKTAVEWLVEKLDQNFDYVADTLIEQAKKMEKEQIIEAHGSKQYHKSISGEQYYNETFKNEIK